MLPVKKLIDKYYPTMFDSPQKWVDPFARYNSYNCITNDLNKGIATDYNLESLEFLKLFETNSIDGVFFDPPYSPRQISECYKGFGKKVLIEDTQSSFWSIRKAEIARLLKPGGLCLSFGWNTNGIGKKHNFEILEILLVAHGAAHNDTICIVEKKLMLDENDLS
tara:strand:- start:481 stop:975 length:495 start_codon:yes stop_codon:yes gene_type:complete